VARKVAFLAQEVEKKNALTTQASAIEKRVCGFPAVY